ncbi:MAG: RHS repeat-associated core domain-containing protein, partial [Phycisphaerae bacterium]|nr:RHS repeat-associated core domain-containing protein [Phycisphaerae bacterium]
KDADYAYVYDAWNNLVKVRAQNDADVVVGVYAYYADNRRASKVVSNRGDLDGTTYFFYDGLREIEERNGAEAVTQQYVWGHEYIDQLLMIRGAGGTWFVHQDANWNVIALTTPNGDVAEEVQYQPYGSPQIRRHLAFGDSDADGDVDSADNTARTAALSTYNRTFDADFDGDVSNTSGDADQEAWDASYNDPAASTTMVVANRSFSPNGNPFLFTGRRLDAETGLYFYRFRTYHPTLKTFLQRDPLGYGASGPSLYAYCDGNPAAWVDPLGLDKIMIVIANDAPWGSRLLAEQLAKIHRYFGDHVDIVEIGRVRAFQAVWRDNTLDKIIFIGHGYSDAAQIRIGTKDGRPEVLTPDRLRRLRPGRRLFSFYIYACNQGDLNLLAAWIWALWDLNIEVTASPGKTWPFFRWLVTRVPKPTPAEQPNENDMVNDNDSGNTDCEEGSNDIGNTDP